MAGIRSKLFPTSVAASSLSIASIIASSLRSFFALLGLGGGGGGAVGFTMAFGLERGRDFTCFLGGCWGKGGVAKDDCSVEEGELVLMLGLGGRGGGGWDGLNGCDDVTDNLTGLVGMGGGDKLLSLSDDDGEPFDGEVRTGGDFMAVDTFAPFLLRGLSGAENLTDLDLISFSVFEFFFKLLRRNFEPGL